MSPLGAAPLLAPEKIPSRSLRSLPTASPPSILVGFWVEHPRFSVEKRMTLRCSTHFLEMVNVPPKFRIGGTPRSLAILWLEANRKNGWNTPCFTVCRYPISLPSLPPLIQYHDPEKNRYRTQRKREQVPHQAVADRSQIQCDFRAFVRTNSGSQGRGHVALPTLHPRITAPLNRVSSQLLPCANFLSRYVIYKRALLRNTGDSDRQTSELALETTLLITPIITSRL
ncbi:hypothetical protein SAMN04487949_3634 [Halogranum gelatinilyticum]|uniref:Uncharacterized protein n=1 Tax=Halogranum gelatinilyticum TaxID=660521 RepID=A0A1G9ZF15_9EURY|nr:hypothetical protein SAMN04487949_3634 [Halogranum gelatinilyticum]